MKVLLFTKMFPRIGNDSFGSYVYDQIKELKALGTDLRIVSPHLYIPKCFSLLGNKFKSRAFAPNKYEYKGLTVYTPPCLWARNLINNPEIKYKVFKLSVKRYLLSMCKEYKPDVLYALDPSMDGRLCLEIGQELNIPVVLIEHSMPKFYNDLYGNGKFEHIYKKVATGIDEMIYVTNRQKEVFETITGKLNNSTAILNGFVQENGEERIPIFSDNILKLICIGYLEERKGYPVLFKALKMLKETTDIKFNLTIIGDGYDMKLYRKTVKEYGIDFECNFVGIVSHKEVYEYLNKSDIFVLPSYGEALGIAYLEAMSCGLPIIGTKNEGISDIVTDNENGILVEKGDVEGICDAIKFLSENPETAKQIAIRGCKTVAGLTWKKNAELLYSRFETVIKTYQNKDKAAKVQMGGKYNGFK